MNKFEERQHEWTEQQNRQGRRVCNIQCPFCHEWVTAHKWSLYGSGKLCKCGAKHIGFGLTLRHEVEMNVKHGNGTTEYGPGVSIDLIGSEVATAIDAYLVAHGVCVSGPRTITVNGELCETGMVYVDPSGWVICDGVKVSGRGNETI